MTATADLAGWPRLGRGLRGVVATSRSRVAGADSAASPLRNMCGGESAGADAAEGVRREQRRDVATRATVDAARAEVRGPDGCDPRPAGRRGAPASSSRRCWPRGSGRPGRRRRASASPGSSSRSRRWRTPAPRRCCCRGGGDTALRACSPSGLLGLLVRAVGLRPRPRFVAEPLTAPADRMARLFAGRRAGHEAPLLDHLATRVEHWRVEAHGPAAALVPGGARQRARALDGRAGGAASRSRRRTRPRCSTSSQRSPVT